MTKLRLCVTTALASVFLLVALSHSVLKPHATAQEGPNWHNGLPRQHESQWLVHDLRRPLPEVVTPGVRSQDAPSDAIMLLDGTNLDHWVYRKGGAPAAWLVKDGFIELNHTGSIQTKEKFEDVQLHIEWANPAEPKGVSQVRGNSGIFFMGRYEVQIVASFNNRTYADGSAASLYGQHPPLVNACRQSGEWQTYDIIFRAPRFDGDKLVEPARVTMFHNGVLVHFNQKFFGSTSYRALAKYSPHGPGPVQIQDHGDRQPMRFRNIWARRLKL